LASAQGTSLPSIQMNWDSLSFSTFFAATFRLVVGRALLARPYR
jgi:hypothetical protein